MRNFQHWRIEESRYACHDIHGPDGRFLTTYEVDLHHEQPAPYSWAQHIADKTWSTPEMVAEIAEIEQSYMRSKLPPTLHHISAPSPDLGCDYLSLLKSRAKNAAAQ